MTTQSQCLTGDRHGIQEFIDRFDVSNDGFTFSRAFIFILIANVNEEEKEQH